MSGGMVLPVAGGISIAFFSQAFNSSPTWYSSASGQLPNVASFTIDRGRQYELATTQTGTATVNFYDTNGTYDPTNPNSPFYPEIGPMRSVNIQLQNPTNGEFYNLFTGFTEAWDYTYPTTPSPALMQAAVSCVDGFDPLSRAELIPDESNTTTFAAINGLNAVKIRMAAILYQFYSGAYGAGNAYPTDQNAIFSGNVNIFNAVYNPQTTILSALQDTADAEFPGVANLFMDKYGNISFRGRGPRFQPQNYSRTDGAPADINLPPTLSQPVQFWNVGDEGASKTFGYVPFSNYEWNLDQTNLVNAAQVYPGNITATASITEQTKVNAQSLIRYGPRTTSYPNLYTAGSPAYAFGDGNPFLDPPGLTAVQETGLFGQYYVDNFSYPFPRISTLTFQTQEAGTVPGNGWWHLVTGIEIGDIITLFTSNPGGGGFGKETDGFQTDQFTVEGLHYSVTPGGKYPQVTLNVDVSPRVWSMFFNGYQWFPGPIPPGVSAVPYGLYGQNTGSISNGGDTLIVPAVGSGPFYAGLVGSTVTVTLGSHVQTLTINAFSTGQEVQFSTTWTGTSTVAAQWVVNI